MAWVYSVGDRHAVELRHYRDDELVDGCVVTPLYADPQPAPDVSGLVEALERFVEAWTDCQQQPVHAEEFEILTDICEDSLKALAAHHKQEGGV